MEREPGLSPSLSFVFALFSIILLSDWGEREGEPDNDDMGHGVLSDRDGDWESM